MIRSSLSARLSNSAMPCPRRAAVLWPLSGASAARGAAVLPLLDPDRVVRRAVAGALATVASSLPPTEVRRLVAMRNWRANGPARRWASSPRRSAAWQLIAIGTTGSSYDRARGSHCPDRRRDTQAGRALRGDRND